jgi:hypothetical protein
MVVPPRGRKSFIAARMLLLPWVGKARFGLLLRRSLMAGRLFHGALRRRSHLTTAAGVARAAQAQTTFELQMRAWKFAISDSRSAHANEANVTVEITEDHVGKSRHHMPVIVQKSLVT